MIIPPWYLTLNVIAVWLLAEAYYMPPRGFHGEPWFVYLAYVWTGLSILLLAITFTQWIFLNLQLWMADG